ncbi:MAG: SDR family NAD(P)-dependent oxidoreductase [Williamsia sp.]|nr:SDR family NAD(P)-dependent oxidoreductase [Williamsia sp.]
MNTAAPCEIAIVGYSYRMPGGIKTDDDFWEVLKERKVIQVPIETRYGKGYVPVAGKSTPGRFASAYEGLIINEEELQFDCKLFGISTHEASQMDPQIKMLLSCTGEAFEKTGWSLHDLRNSHTGVFIGTQDSSSANWRPLQGVSEFTIPGSCLSMFSNRISYHFNLMGPSTSTLTACSSGISALHAAITSIRCGDCKQAVVGASNYLGSFIGSTGFNALGVISPDGKCHSFDASANGYMRAEGVFAYVIKPLADAERDGDPIHTVIADTYLNTAGTADDSTDLMQGRYITAPTTHAQVSLMPTIAERSGILPERFDYIEAHATGTKLGDKIEGNSIGQVFGGFRRKTPLRVASVKSNLGHMEAAAFNAGLLKAILMMKHRMFAPISRNYVIPNPEIDFSGLNMQVQTACEPFPQQEAVIGINSFGFGGANGMCVLKEYRPQSVVPYSQPLYTKGSYLFPLSARTLDALVKTAAGLREAMETETFDLYTLAGNLSTRRTHYGTRTFFVADSRPALTDALKNFEDLPENYTTINPGNPRILLVFSGQGVQWAGCGKELYQAHPVFRRALDAIEAYWRQYSDTSLIDACFHADQTALDECRLAQPVIFMIQCGLVELLKTWGVYADGVVGHSAGEVAAAYASGALSLEEATRLVYYRATLQQRTAGSGRMLAIGLDRAGVEALLQEAGLTYGDGDGLSVDVEIACENAPASMVVCGKGKTMQPLIQLMESRSIQHRLLRGNIAFHSQAMNGIKEDVFTSLRFLDDGPFDHTTPFISSVTGKLATQLDSAYWWTNIRRPVLFSAAIEEAAIVCKPDIVLEVSPHNALSTVVEQCFEKAKYKPVCLGTLKRNKDTLFSFQEALGGLYQQGVPLNFAAQYPRPEPITHLLPAYPREEQKMMDPLVDDVQFLKKGQYSHGPLVGQQATWGNRNFEVRMAERDFPWLADHCVQQIPIVPAAGYIEMVLEALGGEPLHFTNLEFLNPCEIGKTALRLQTEIQPLPGTSHDFTFTISSKPCNGETDTTLHCKGAVRKVEKSFTTNARAFKDINQDLFTPTPFQKPGDYYKQIDALLGDAFQYGPYFQTVERVFCNIETKELLLELRMDETLFADSKRDGYILPPSLMDGALQAFIYYLLQATDIAGIPRAAKELTILHPPTSPGLLCYYCPPAYWKNSQEKGQLTLALGEQPCGSITLYDKNTGLLIAHLDQYFSFHSNANRADIVHSKKLIRWQPKWGPDATWLLPRLSPAEPNPAQLIETLEHRNENQPYSCRVIEFTGQQDPEQALLKTCLHYLQSDRAQAEYWVLSSDLTSMQKQYEAFNHADAALRFDYIDLSADKPLDLTRGLLRAAAAELLLVDVADKEVPAVEWEKLARLLVPGGLILAYHAENNPLQLLPGWDMIKTYPQATLIQLSFSFVSPLPEATAIQWVVGKENSFAPDWKNLAVHQDIHFIPWNRFIAAESKLNQLPHPQQVESIHVFCTPAEEDPTGEEWVKGFVLFIQQFIAFRTALKVQPCRINIITNKAAFRVENPSQSTIWGTVRCMAMELNGQSSLDFTLIDVGDEADLATLAGLPLGEMREQELAIAEQQVWVPRIINLKDEYPLVKAGGSQAYRLMVENPGQITGLQFKTCALPKMGPDEIEVEVKAAALNFRDVMVALGRLPLLSYERSALGHEVGMEASGVVKRIGSQVTRWKKGDEVVFMQGGCIANRVITNEKAAFKKPSNISMAEAAGTMSVYVTAYYALIYLSRLRKGQRVLIHSALGGVGQAAIALAKWVGAEIYVTAGSREKQARLIQLGAKAAFDSHSFSWYDELMQETNGEGVDVVLNSLAGHHIRLCLEALKPGGWHCEIGKVDIYADNTMNLCVFRKNLRFLAIDVDRLMNDDPELSIQISQTCLDLIGSGVLPALPVKTFDYSAYEEAFRFMMNGYHTGKLVLEAPGLPQTSSLRIADTQPFLDATGTYLVTGGLGGFGLRLLPYLVWAGAKHLTLMDRDPERRRSVEWLRQQSQLAALFPDVEIRIMQGDVAQEEAVIRCISQLDKPLKGVFHLAGVIDDQLITNLTSEAFDKVFAPKAMGALYLHRATRAMALDYFVVLSSIAAVFGSPGQINYGAANAFMEGLVAHRKQQGLAGLSFIMGGVAEAGMASRDTHVLRMLKASGIPAISTLFAINGLDYALRLPSEENHLVTALFKRIPWTTGYPDYLRFGRLMSNRDCLKAGSGEQLTPEGISAKIAKKVAELCGHEEIDQKEPIASFGLNSISVSELAAFINTQFNYQVSVIDLMTKASSRSLAIAIIEKQQDTGEQNKTADPEKEEQAESKAVLSTPVKTQAPSPFATTYQDHFPGSTAEEAGSKPTYQPSGLLAHLQEHAVHISYRSYAVPKLEGSLPPDCQTDLDELRTFIQQTLRNAMPDKAVKASDIRTVLLTGATGFIGRFMLRDLLQYHPDIVVVCLVRACDKQQGMERIRQALSLADLWQEAFGQRIRVIAGDICQPRFGLDGEQFEELKNSIDAVYHLAADLTLASPYNTIRQVNTNSIRHVLSLVLGNRFKHFFYASTMGVFPQYFGHFANEFTQSPIGTQAQPDVDSMKGIFPLQFIGYPWSKLVVEQSLLFAQSAGMPLGIFRFPQTCIAAESGYVQSGDIKIRITMAVLSTGLMPANYVNSWTEPVDTITRFCTAISLNEERRYTVYHCINPEPVTHDIEYADANIPYREVPYETFREACQKQGSASPLDGYWPLVDYFAPYWFSKNKTTTPLPLSDEAVREDCPYAIEWPGFITATVNSNRWIINHKQTWPFAIPESNLGLDAFRERAGKYAGQLGVDYEEAFASPTLEGLKQLVEGLHKPAARLLEERKSTVALSLNSKLYDIVSLARERAIHPEILQEQIDQPVFILGINRTGTTFLHRLLSRDEQFWTLKPYEIMRPVIKGGNYKGLSGTDKDPRRAFTRDLINAYNAVEGFAGIHHLDIEEPEEEFALLESSFAAWSLASLYHVPEYKTWLEQHGSAHAYKVHKQIMQHYSWQRKQTARDQKQWLLKMPYHLKELSLLLKTYPDAIIIQTHRNPCEFMGSWNHLIEQAQSLMARPQDKYATGADQLRFMSSMLNEAMQYRAAHPLLENRWIDISYYDLIKNPLVMVEHIYTRLGRKLGDEARTGMQAWLQQQAEARKNETRHSYTLEEYGLTGDEVMTTFKPYLDFAQSRGIKVIKEMTLV